MAPTILVINPNSSTSITDGLRSSLKAIKPSFVELEFYTAPSHAAKAISDFRTMNSTSTHCYEDLLANGAFRKFDAFLVCCFSDHPLQHMIREELGPLSTKPCVGMFESAVVEAMMLTRRFGVVCTGSGPKPLLIKGVSSFLGGSASDRWAGCLTSGLAVLELREGDMARVERLVKETSGKVAKMGAEAIIMGCAGFAGMDEWVQQGVEEAGCPPVRVIDGAKAGLRTLAGMLSVQ